MPNGKPRTGWIFSITATAKRARCNSGLYEDASRYDSSRVTVTAPALVFQGRKDTLVDADMVERFVAARPTMTLQLLDDDHQLLASLEFIWKATAVFLRLDP